MKKTLGLMSLLLLFGGAAKAQDSGFSGPISANADSLKGVLPPINQPQAGWTPVADLKDSDGTATVPSCSDPLVLATVKDGIMSQENAAFPPTMGPGPVTKVDMSTVWVHPTDTNSTVCDVSVQTDMPMTGPEEWEFQAFASNGQVRVFFYDKNTQTNQGN